MNSYIRQILAVAAAGAVTGALAQQAAAPDAAAPTPVLPISEQPMFSIAAGAQGPNAEAAHAIVQALAAEKSLKGSKITVSPEEKRILLTGVAPTLEQAARAVQLATEHAGEGNVVNGLATEQVYVDPNPSGLAELNPEWFSPSGSQTS